MATKKNAPVGKAKRSPTNSGATAKKTRTLPRKLAAFPAAAAYDADLGAAPCRGDWVQTLEHVAGVVELAAKRLMVSWSIEKKWGMPTIVFGGRNALHVACFKSHVGLFMSPSVLAQHESNVA